MISERVRRALLRDLVSAGDRLLAALKDEDRAAVGEAMAAVAGARAQMNDRYVCEMSARFDEVERCMLAVTTGTPAETRALRDAVDLARGHVVGAVARGTSWRAIYFGGGVRLVQCGEPLRQTYDVDARILCDRFGVPLVAAVLRLMAGASRIVSLLHFISINGEHVTEDSVAFERNFQFAAMQSFAYLKEITEVIGALGSARLGQRLTDPEPWELLKELSRYWERDSRKTMRAAMFHLGDVDETQAELTKLAGVQGTRLDLIDHDVKGDMFGTRFTAGEGLVIKAGLEVTDLRELATEAVGDAYGQILTLATRIVDDLLRQCGARMPNIEVRSTVLLRLPSRTERVTDPPL